MKGRVLVIAGSDPIAGAGLQADLKTITALGGYGMTVVTAITVQNRHRVLRVVPLATDLIEQQMTACIEDIGVDTVKIGMLACAEIVTTVSSVLRRYAKNIPIVIDPVLASTTGGTLLDSEGIQFLREQLFSHACLLTPNIPEAEQLTGQSIKDVHAMESAASVLAAFGVSVLIKGGHLEETSPENRIIDLLFHQGKYHRFIDSRILGPGFHGTGCTLASGIATGIALGKSLEEAVMMARFFVRHAMQNAFQFETGQWLLNHHYDTFSKASSMPSQA